ncbi:hypothetical protein BH09BAC3_BH09BAC3_19490 [soil metagenome]
MQRRKRIAIIGGGPSGLFMFKSILNSGQQGISIDIFEKGDRLGAGMPYSSCGSNVEHVTNVSGNEIPELLQPLDEWIKTLPSSTLEAFDIDVAHFNDFKVVPRLLFGSYLEDQFNGFLSKAKLADLPTKVHYNKKVTDIIDGDSHTVVELNETLYEEFDVVIICTGHHWLSIHERERRYFDSPYPPSKLSSIINHSIAITGSSLTAIDAIRTLARNNGKFYKGDDNTLVYVVDKNSPDFHIVLHSRHGLLPAVRFHLEDSHLGKNLVLAPSQISEHMTENNGFLSLDYIFENDFKKPMRAKDPVFYDRIKDLDMEGFVTLMMDLREQADPFLLFKSEYWEANKSIKNKESISWKEMLAILSFAMNYPAKHFSAEDMIRLQHVLMPLISIVIAFVPQSSCEELIALHEAGRLDIVSVGSDSRIEYVNHGVVYNYPNSKGENVQKKFDAYINCTGQVHLSIASFPFQSLVKSERVSQAKLKFRKPEHAEDFLSSGRDGIRYHAGEYYMDVPGLTINDCFQAVNTHGDASERIFIMAVPYIAGFNPDYSGLDFCEEASGRIANALLKQPSWNCTV